MAKLSIDPDELVIILMCGSRDWSSGDTIEKHVLRLIEKHGTQNLLIVEGGAPGADQVSGYYGRMHNVHVAEIKALWDTRHNGAGPQRNDIMLSLMPNGVLAFHKDITKSKGTKDTVKKAEALGIPVKIVKR